MSKNFDSAQNYYSTAVTSKQKIGHDSIRKMKCLACFNKSYYENINYFDLMGSILNYLIETCYR